MGLSAEVLSQDPLVYSSQKLTTQLQTRHDDRHLIPRPPRLHRLYNMAKYFFSEVLKWEPGGYLDLRKKSKLCYQCFSCGETSFYIAKKVDTDQHQALGLL